jgi:hypothetical protein
LTPAPRRQDHTSLPYAQAAIVYCNLSVHRDPSNVRDDGRRPLSGTGWLLCELICDSVKEKYFLFWGLTLLP